MKHIRCDYPKLTVTLPVEYFEMLCGYAQDYFDTLPQTAATKTWGPKALAELQKEYASDAMTELRERELDNALNDPGY